MKAVMVKAPYDVVIEEVDKRALKRDEVRVRVYVAGICGSDVHTYKGLHPFRVPPVVMGHEASGVVVECGGDVDTVDVGERVTVLPQKGCGVCADCARGRSNLCAKREAPGVGEWMGLMVEEMIVPACCVYKLRDGISDEAGVLAEPLAVAVHAVKKANLGIAGRVAILGAGPIGLLTLAVARYVGVAHVTITDVQAEALVRAQVLGANQVIQLGVDEAAWAQQQGLCDAVFVAAGAPGVVNQSMDLLKKGGRAVAVAMFPGEQPLDVVALQQGERELVGSMTYTPEDMDVALTMLAQGVVPVEALVSHVLPYTEAREAFALVHEKRDGAMKVLLSFRDEGGKDDETSKLGDR
ncbi:alcohol dehydrogenase catalytic domain-containing protein [Shouchella sp. 1P09AA]|uniref:zinc-dependent alcohol dehydrogenase n=1 Tax=unclassified Shouchella TaxID=2893065 RepID=UPI0039A09402